MADEVQQEPPLPPPSPRRQRAWLRHVGVLMLGLALLLGAGLYVLDTAIGHRFVVERIAQLSPKSGLRIRIGRIEGSIYDEAVLRDVQLLDPKGVFARIPEADLKWRPLSWLRSGVDIRSLLVKRGTLLRAPELLPGDPDAPMLPDYDIVIDRLEVTGFTVAKGILGEERKLSLYGKADIRDGRAMVRLDGRLGGGDRLFALLDMEPDGDKFDVKLDYAAPKGGLLAGMAGADAAMAVKVVGKGKWSEWNGVLFAERDGKWLAALKLRNRSGRYGILGQVYPADMLAGLPRRAAGRFVNVSGDGTFAQRVFDGRIVAASPALGLVANGRADLGRNRFEAMHVGAALADPALLGEGTRIEGATLAATLDGDFRDLAVGHLLRVRQASSGAVRLENLVQGSTAHYDGTRWQLPLNVTAGRIVTGSADVDRRLVNARLRGTLGLAGSRLDSNDIAFDVPGLAARLILHGDLARGGYGLAGAAAARGWPLPNLGTANADAKLVLGLGPGHWDLRTNFAGRMVRVDNQTLTSIAGTGIRVNGGISMGSGKPLLIQRAQFNASKLNLSISGRRLANGYTTIGGGGRHVDYGPFTVQASVGGDGPRAVLVFADPLPAAGLKDVRIALAPIKDGFRIETAGGSTLGPFQGVLGLFSRPGGPTRIEIETLDIWKTSVTGGLTLGNGAASGRLLLAGGGVDGSILLAPRGGGQGFDVALSADNARFGGASPLIIRTGRLQASGFFADKRSSINGNLTAQNVGRGNLFIASLDANAAITDGRGRATAAIAGRRSSRFNLQLGADIAPGRYAILARGDFAGEKLTMPRRAVLTSEAGGWRLAPTQINFGGGRMVLSGTTGSRMTSLELALADMPLSLGNLFVADLGLGGKGSGLVTYRQVGSGVPTGSAQLQLKALSRSGLVLTSRPVDLALVADLSATTLQARAVVREGGQTRGRVQARISGLPQQGPLGQRLGAGRLFAQLRYDGPADALWRLAAIDAFDLTGPVAIAADATGTIANPQIRGSLSANSLRLQSALTGTDVSGIAARGRFTGSRLELLSFAGRTFGEGTVTGTGSFDLSDLQTKGLGIDMRIAARNARVLARDDMAARVTGPLRIVSDGATGTIAGRVEIETARWQLGSGDASEDLPDIRTREINNPRDTGEAPAIRTIWRYMIDARAPNRVTVRGMGLDSEWSADIRLRGTVDAPAIAGRADLVRGGYEFAGKRFELTRGRINFDGGSPPNPRLDVAAEVEDAGITARVNIGGTALRPEITFTSTPALPEDELLSRLLFGSSVTDISAPEAVQLGAALASLRGGGGLDPINKLRSAVGLDRLRIVSADAASGRGTGIAAGKYLGRKLYAEIVTDGRGYSATQLEFRITSWLSILGSVSSVGHQSLNAKVSKDY